MLSKDAIWLLERMKHCTLDMDGLAYNQLVKDYKKWKKNTEDNQEEPGEAILIFTEFWEDERFQVYRAVSKARFEATEEGKERRRKWNQRAWKRRKDKPGYKEAKKAYDLERAQDPNYKEAKKAYDRERYLKRKAAKVGQVT